MAHDTENLTFPRNSVVVPCRHPWMVVRNDADLPHGCRRSFAGADADFPCVWVRIFRANLG